MSDSETRRVATTSSSTSVRTRRLARFRGTVWAGVGRTALTKMCVMGLSGLLALFTTRLILRHFGTAAYAQYGLLASFPNLLPFADLGMAAVVINAVASADDVHSDTHVRRSITTAFRILVVAGAVIGSLGLLFAVFGWWPILLGSGLTPDGPSAALACVLIFGLVLPMTVGQRIMVGLRRTSTQVAAQSVVAPFMFCSVGLVVLTGIPFGNFLSVFSYIGNALVSVICLIIAARLIRPQLGRAIRDIPRIRTAPGVSAFNLAWPMIVQMVALPVAMQTDRLLLSHLTTGPELAQYSLASQLFGMVLQAIAAGGVAMWPVYARARARSQVESPMKPVLAFTAAGVGMAGILFLASGWIARFVSGGSIELPFGLLAGFVAFVAVQAAKYPLGMYMTDLAGLRFQVWPILVLVPVNLVLSWQLVSVVGAGGPIIGSAVAVLLCQVLPNLWYVRRDLRLRSGAVADPDSAAGPPAT